MASKSARPPLKTKRKSRGKSIGTKVALNRSLISGTSISPTPPAGKRGGARLKADRSSDSLSLQQCRNIIQAAHASGNIGLPLQRHLTVHWGAYRIEGAAAGQATSRLLKLAGDYCRKHGQPFAAVWVRECDLGDGSKGDHTHFLLHVPLSFAPRFVRMQRRWLKIVTGQRYNRNTMKTARIGRHLSIAATNPALYAENLSTVIGYILKAASPAAREALALSRPAEYGRVIGKRCGWTEILGQAARKRWMVCQRIETGP